MDHGQDRIGGSGAGVTVSAHVLDGARGGPVAGVGVRLDRLADDREWEPVTGKAVLAHPHRRNPITGDRLINVRAETAVCSSAPRGRRLLARTFA